MEDDEQADEAALLLEVIRDYADHRLEEHAVAILGSLRDRRAIGVETIRPWPYAGPQAEAGLLSEMFYAFSDEPGIAEMSYRHLLLGAARRFSRTMPGVEIDLFFAAIRPDLPDVVTLSQQERALDERLVEACILFLRNNDEEGLLAHLVRTP